MIIDLSDLSDGPKNFDVVIRPDEIDLEIAGAKLEGNISLSGVAAKHSSGISIAGRVAADIWLECSRCLESVRTKIAADFISRFVALENFAANREIELAGEDLDTDVLERDELDLSNIAREQIFLNLPAQFFCRDDCRGLCEKCGQNLNLLTCNCGGGEIDPRWSALKNLK